MNKRPNPEQLITQIIDLVKDHLPEGVEALGQDLRGNLKSLVAESLTKMDLVSREEFEVQKKVLARTRTKLEVLEKEVAAIELKAESN